MDRLFIDNLFVFFSLIYYASLIVVYLLRAHELGELELKMGPWFSIQLIIPFTLLWVIDRFALVDRSSCFSIDRSSL